MALINSPEISEALKEGKRIINLTLKVEIEYGSSDTLYRHHTDGQILPTGLRYSWIESNEAITIFIIHTLNPYSSNGK